MRGRGGRRRAVAGGGTRYELLRQRVHAPVPALGRRGRAGRRRWDRRAADDGHRLGELLSVARRRERHGQILVALARELGVLEVVLQRLQALGGE
jgi:hypothetical protein